jgi:uncharacterized protein (TIGR00730 family)
MNGTIKISKQRRWSESKAHSSWQIFKIMAEFVDGFEALAKLGPCISIFGSARTQPGHAYYELTVDIARKVAEEGFGIISGGGPGIMEAANRGAHEMGVPTVGLNIALPHEQGSNPYVTPSLSFKFHYFALRKMHFMMRAKALVAFPGGFGTLDELFEVITLVQTRKAKPVPIILFGSDYWKRLLNFDVLIEEGAISPEDLKLFEYVDDPQVAWDAIKTFYQL